MRVKIIGDTEPARALRGYLYKSGIAVVDVRPDYTVTIEEKPGPDHIVFDSIDCELERKIFRHVRLLTETPVSVQTAGGVQSDTELKIVLSNQDKDRQAVEAGVLRGLLEVLGVKTRCRPWWKRILPLALLMILLPVPGWSQFQIYGIMRPSGPKHLPGYVPDPGAIAGITKFLREDATWQAPIFAPVNHSLLSATHGDTTPLSPPVRGDIITAQGVAPLWTALAKGAQYQVLISGATDPGWSASPTIGTSVTTPILYGGAAAGSTLTLDGTSSGAPVNAYVLLNPAEQGGVGIGLPVPLVQLHVSSSSTPVLFFDYYNNVLTATPLQSRAARGTPALPTAVQINDFIGGFSARGYGATGFSAGGRAAITYRASETWTDAAQGTFMTFVTTLIGSIVPAERIRILDDGKVGINTIAPGYQLEVAGSLSATSFYVGAAAGVDKVCTAAPTAMTVDKGIITAITCI